MDKNVLDALYKKTGIGAKISDVISAIQGHEASDGHDNRYYTETEVDGLLAGKADDSHAHGLATPSFRAVRDANQAVSSGSPELVDFDAVQTYNGAVFGQGVLPSFHLPQEDGIWLYTFRCAFQSAPSGMVLEIYLNEDLYQLYALPGGHNYGEISALIEVAENDYVSCYVEVASAVIIQGGSLWTSFHGVQIG